jgi:serine/threonine-protein kinase
MSELAARLAGATTASIDVPDTTGLPLFEAQARLAGLDVEVVVAEERLNDPAVPAGHVLAQDPIGSAPAGSTVSLVLSAGPRRVTVPMVASTDPDVVAAALVEAGLVPERDLRHDDTVPEGAVVTLEPGTGTEVDEGATVRIVVSSGPPPVPVPSVVGLALGQASERLRELGLELDVASRRFDGSPAGTILTQEPGEGVELRRGTVVTVVVSDGPAPVEVPNLRGRPVADAVAELEALGLKVEVIRRGGPAALLTPDRVYDQDPGPGRTLRPGESVILWAYDA